MAKSIDTILKELNLSEDSTLEELFSKLEDYSVVKDAEILGIKNISVKALPTVVKNQEEAVKRKMYGIVTDEEKGVTSLLNKRIVILLKVLRTLASASADYDYVNSRLALKADKQYVDVADEEISRRIDQNELNISANTQNIETLIEKIEEKDDIAEVDKKDAEVLKTAKSYADTKVSELIDSAPEALNTLRELAEAIKAHEDAYDAMLEVIGGKANSADVYTKTETDSKLEEIKEEASSYSKSFTGTFAEYETASANGLIPNGMIVYILDDDDEVVDERTSSLLGTGVLGYMILG